MRILKLGAVGLAATLANAAAYGCAACFGKSDSQMAYGMNAGILTLLAVILPVLALIATFFAYIVLRARRINQSNESDFPAS